MRVNIANLFRTDASILHCPPHRADHAALRFVRRSHVISISGHTVAYYLSVDTRAATTCMFYLFEDHDPCAFADHKPIAVAIERTTGTFGVVVARGEGAHRRETRHGHRRDG